MSRHRLQVARRGSAMIAALALLVVVTSLSVSWTTTLVRARQATRLSAQLLQAERLAEAGVARAAARLGSDSTYSGETWRLAPGDLGQSYDAAVLISVDREGDRVRLVAEATLPATGPRRARRTRSLSLPLRLDAPLPSPDGDDAQ